MRAALDDTRSTPKMTIRCSATAICVLLELTFVYALPAPATTAVCTTAWSCVEGFPNGYCDNGVPTPNFMPLPAGTKCDASVENMYVVDSANTTISVEAASTGLEVELKQNAVTTVTPTTTPTSTPTGNGAQGVLVYPPTTCPYVSSAYAGGVTTAYTTSLATWTSSSYVPVSTPTLGGSTASAVTLPGGYSCVPSEPNLTNGGQSASCVEGGQMASTYTAEPGANCVDIDFDPLHSLVAAYAAPAGATTPFCGQALEITAKATRNKITVVIVDACPTCWGVQQVVSGTYATRNGATIDLSASAFTALFGLDWNCGGVYDVEYTPLNGSFTPQASYGEVS